MYWQRALFGVFVLVVFEGALRKWVLPGAQAQIYFLKDVILLTAYVGFLITRYRFEPISNVGAIQILLLSGFIFGCLEVLNPSSPSILVGLIGLKAYFFYVPIAFILPYAFKSREDFLHLIKLYLLLAIPVALLGFAQVAAGPESSINAYVSYTENTALGTLFGRDYDIVRTSGTFSYISGYTTYLTFIGFLSIGYNLARQWRIRNNVGTLATLVFVIGAMFTTGSRGPVYTIIAAAPLILWLALRGGLLSADTAIRVSILVPIIGIAALNISPAAVEAFADRAADADSSYVVGRIFSIDSMIDALMRAPILGLGIGVTHNTAPSVMGTDWPTWLGDLLFEDEWARVIIELGVFGFLLQFALRLLVCAFAFRCAIYFRDPVYRAFGIVLLAYLALGLVVPIVNNVTANFYYWSALGLILAMRRLDQSAVLKGNRRGH